MFPKGCTSEIEESGDDEHVGDDNSHRYDENDARLGESLQRVGDFHLIAGDAVGVGNVPGMEHVSGWVCGAGSSSAGPDGGGAVYLPSCKDHRNTSSRNDRATSPYMDLLQQTQK